MRPFRFTPFLALALLPLAAAAQTLPDKAAVLEAMQRANTYFVAKWPDPGLPIVTDRSRPSNIWTRGTYYEGALALYRIDRSIAIHDYAVAWGTAHAWNFNGGATTRNADNQCAGQTYLELYLLDPQPARIANVRTSLLAMVNSTKRDDWSWIDALHMAMPVFAKLGAVDNDARYAQTMYELFDDTRTRRALYNATEHLWWRDANFKPPYQTPGGKNCYWSRGNGWVYAALVRTLDILPANDPHRADYRTVFLQMSAALLPLQRTDGFWNPSLADPTDFGGKETSGTAMFTYGMAWGIRQGILPAEVYLPVVTKAWNAMVNDTLHPNGFLGWMQGTGAQPSDGQPLAYDKVPNFEDYGLGCFLLAGSEVYRLVEQPPATTTATAGRNVSFSAPPHPGSPAPTYRWQISTDGGATWTDLSDNATYSGTATRTLTIVGAASALHDNKYRYVATATTGTTTGSAQTLNVAPAFLAKPVSLAISSAGTIFVSDETNHTIGTIAPGGAFSVFAGSTGSLGSVNGPGTAARFRSPGGLALDSAGNLYVADTGNSTIRKIAPVVGVSTVAGSASQSGAADGTGAAARFASPVDVALNPQGIVFVADTGNHTLRVIDGAAVVTTRAGAAGTSGHQDATGNSATFSGPAGLAVNPVTGAILVADTGNNTVRHVTPAGAVTTLAGTWGLAGHANGSGSSASFSGPTGCTADSSGNLYLADTNNSLIRKITPAGDVTTLAGLPGVAGHQDGPGTEAMFNQPRDVALDPDATHLYVADAGNAAIRKIALSTGAVTTLALNPSSSSGSSSSSGGPDYPVPQPPPPPSPSGQRAGAPSPSFLVGLLALAGARALHRFRRSSLDSRAHCD